MATPNNKTSLLVSSELPEFIREEHALFVQFLEYYYQALEQEGQTLYLTKNIPHYLDINQLQEHIVYSHSQGNDYFAYQDFMKKMYDVFTRYVPDSILADRVLVLKHAKEFYRATGSEKSVQFLIQALFDKQADFYYPKTDILRTSDGKWFVEKSLKVTNVQVDNTSNSVAVSNFANTTITGLTSGATAIVEKVDIYFDKGQLINELKLSSINKQFQNAEEVYAYYTEEGVDHYLTAQLFSGVIVSAEIVSGGSGYTEGTTIPVVSTSGSGAEIVVSSVTSGTIQAAGVIRSGAGFRINDPLVISGSGYGASGYVSNIDNTGFYHPNSYNVMWTTINLEANTPIGNAKYSNLVSSVTDPANNWMTNSMSYFAYSNCGPAYSLAITNGGNNYVPPISISISANSIISKMGILGKMEIGSPGTGYANGDLVVFTNVPGGSGSGALGYVNVNSSGSLVSASFAPVKGQIIGGSGYDSYNLPVATIISGTGVGGTLYVTATIGHNEEITQSVSNIGTILAMTIISGGSGYTDNPHLSLDMFGDGTANVILTTVTGAFSYPGRYISDDGHLSSTKYIEDRDYYQEFSYVVRVDENINNYRQPLKDLTHPAGTKLFGDYVLNYDQYTTTNTNVQVSYANTDVEVLSLESYYQVQGYTSGVFTPNVTLGYANAEFITGSFSMNTSNHLSTFTAQNNSIVLNYANHTFVSGDYVYLHFDTNASSNLVNTVYTVNSTNANYIFVNNPKTETVSGNTGNARVFKPVIMINVPYSQPSVNSNVYLQFKTVDPSLINTYYQVVGTVGTNTFNVLHPNMVTANDSANVANLITKKITVTANNHQFNVGDQAYVLLINGDTANTHNGYYTVTAVGSPNTFNVQASNVIFAGSSARVYQKYSTITIANHPLANGTNVYISFVGGDQANASNGIYAPVKISSNQMVLNVAKPTTANSNVRVWYSTNNYSNITFTEFRTSSNVTAGQNVEIRYNASGADLANGFYTVISKYTSNTYNVHYTSNNSIVNATSTYGSQVFIPGGMNTINAISHSGVGIVANSVMEGIAYVSPYK